MNSSGASVLIVSLLVVGSNASWQNDWGKNHSFTCPTGKAVARIRSEHDNYNEDRRWEWSCKETEALVSDGQCKWTNYLNMWDNMLNYECPSDQLLVGTYSYHDNYRGDRRFKYLCCMMRKGCKRMGCSISGYINSYDGDMDLNVSANTQITGLWSEHNNYYEDRRWIVKTCLFSCGLGGSGEILKDFDAHYYNWASNYADNKGYLLLYAEAYGTNPLLNMMGHGKYKINVEVANVQYSTATEDVEKPSVVMSHWVYNSGNDNVITKVSEAVAMSRTFKWSITEGLKIGMSAKVSAGIPEIMDVEFGTSVEFSLSSTKEKTTTTTVTTTVEDTITVPPKTSLQWIITSSIQDLTVPWTADILIGGYIVVWTAEASVEILPASLFTGDGFVNDGGALRYRAKGVFKGIAARTSSLHMKFCDYDIQQATGECIDNTTGEEAKFVVYKKYPRT